MGDTWWVALRDFKQFNHYDGFSYIQLALRQPDKDLKATKMHGLVTGDRKYEEDKERMIEAARRASEEGQGDPEEEGTAHRQSGDSGGERGDGVDDVVDSTAIHDYEYEVRKLTDAMAGLRTRTRDRGDHRAEGGRDRPNHSKTSIRYP